MRGHLSFVLVFLSVILLFHLLELQLASKDFNLSKAVAVQRIYSVQMNIKENILEASRQGAVEGFTAYDSSHDISLCRHCPDHACIPASPTNFCDAALCSRCFREGEAREHAEEGALLKLVSLKTHGFDPDFSSSIGDAGLSAYLKAEPLSSNGFSFSHVQFQDDVLISLSSVKFSISAQARIPGGCVIYGEGPSIC